MKYIVVLLSLNHDGQFGAWDGKNSKFYPVVDKDTKVFDSREQAREFMKSVDWDRSGSLVYVEPVVAIRLGQNDLYIFSFTESSLLLTMYFDEAYRFGLDTNLDEVIEGASEELGLSKDVFSVIPGRIALK